MPIPSQRFDVWARLYDRFTLEPSVGESGPPSVSEIVIPVTDADALVTDRVRHGALVNLSGSGDIIAHTVPTGKRWVVQWIMLIDATGSTQVGIRETGSSTVYLDTLATGQHVVNMGSVQMEANDNIVWASTGNGGDTARSSRVWLKEIDLRFNA